MHEWMGLGDSKVLCTLSALNFSEDTKHYLHKRLHLNFEMGGSRVASIYPVERWRQRKTNSSLLLLWVRVSTCPRRRIISGNARGRHSPQSASNNAANVTISCFVGEPCLPPVCVFVQFSFLKCVSAYVSRPPAPSRKRQEQCSSRLKKEIQRDYPRLCTLVFPFTWTRWRKKTTKKTPKKSNCAQYPGNTHSWTVWRAAGKPSPQMQY